MRLTDYLRSASRFTRTLYGLLAAFGVYFCMYAFRKPFTVATFEGLSWAGVDYKIWLVIAQVLGYAASKFVGIKFISESAGQRGRALQIVFLILLSELALLGFALVPAPYNIVFLFLNGAPLGMIWGLVFSYLEGRQESEVLGAGLSISFIISSGMVKSVGKWVMEYLQSSPFWMPFVTGLLFVGPLLLFTWMLEQLPPPTAEDQAARTVRRPMTGAERRAFFAKYAAGIILLVVFYIALTIFRDFRDNFAAELWTALGYGKAPGIFTWAELPVALGTALILGSFMTIRDNRKALIINLIVVLIGSLAVGGLTWLFSQGVIDPLTWMIGVGLGLYIGYVPFNCILFDRLIAAVRYPATAGFLIYVADAFGYLGSVGILVYKNFGQNQVSWIVFFQYVAYALSAIACLTLLPALFYFRRKIIAAPVATWEEQPPVIHLPDTTS